MGKQEQKPMEYTPEADMGTYQTGSTQPPKHYRGVIAALLITVTCLGGLASALGIINIRLLAQLEEQADNASASVHQQGNSLPTKGHTPDNLAPTLPKPHNWGLELVVPETTDSPSTEEILSKSTDSSVAILCQYASGSTADLNGLVVDALGYIVTNAHALEDASTISVTLSDGRQFPATLVGMDGFTDLAVIFIDAPGLTEAEFVNSNLLVMGDFLASIDQKQTIQAGALLGNNHSYTVGGGNILLVGTDLKNFTGPIYNGQGQIAGIGSAFLADCCEGGNKSCAISSITVKSVVEQIIAYGFVPGRPCLDVDLETVQTVHQQYWHLPGGLRVTHIEPGAVTAAGLEPGDIITALNGQNVTDWKSYYQALWGLTPGQQVQVQVFREGQYIPLTLTVAQSGR